jgi:hypothetical protein
MHLCVLGIAKAGGAKAGTEISKLLCLLEAADAF